MKKYLTNPVIAAVLTLLLVFGSVLLNTRIRLGKECQALSDRFYDEDSISALLGSLCNASEELVQLGMRYQTDDAEDASGPISRIRELTRLHSYRAGEIFGQYEKLLKDTFALESALARIQLTEEDAERFVNAQHAAAEAKAAIDKAPYNDLVWGFQKKNGGFPTLQLAGLSGLSMPEYFA